jgi:hypothetical protein
MRAVEGAGTGAGIGKHDGTPHLDPLKPGGAKIG